MTSMDISVDSTANSTTVSQTQSSSGLSISVHPLVLLNISDHYTRTKLQNPSIVQNGRVFGALLASQSGRSIDIVNSFELCHKGKENKTEVLDKEFLTYKLEQLKQVFPTLDFMGWYTIGTQPTDTDLSLHDQFLSINESSLFLQLNPTALVEGTKHFPIDIYEPIMDIKDNGHTHLAFVKMPYRLETGEAERIAIDHVAKPSSATSDTTLGNTLISHMITQRNAIAMLHSRIQFLHQYLQDVDSGLAPINHDILRQISSSCKRSTVLEKQAFQDQFSTEYNDVLLVAYLGSITKGLNSVNDLTEKFNLVNGMNPMNQARRMNRREKSRKLTGWR
ncbi:maintenance of mitochondrial structure and function-domain-containing protein [Sporodiniella umbellata]|nr:maintenance of mitochondrial structure and function-domain-containing protein [Sporodiniella umbellata]